MESQSKKIQCKFCGAWFDEMSPKCPYCDSTNLKGAEAEYMERLEDVRSDMEDLAQVPAQETKKELKKQTKFILIIMGIVLGVFFVLLGIELMFGSLFNKRDKQADYIWQQENFPIFDELYEQGKYEELMELYYQAVEEDKPIYDWEHYEYCSAIVLFSETEDIWEKEQAGEALTQWDHVELLYIGFRVNEYEESTAYSREEKEKLAPYIEQVRKDFETRWNFTDEELAAFEEEAEENYGHISYDYCEKYVKKWLERNGK